jgi:hypothetical protein
MKGWRFNAAPAVGGVHGVRGGFFALGHQAFHLGLSKVRHHIA